MNEGDRLAALGREAAALVEDRMLVGLGTGSTANAMIHALGERVQSGLRLTGVATSIATQRLAESLGIEMTDLDSVDHLDLCVDGADEIDPNLDVVKGRGGALLFEKLVARQASRYVIIATVEKMVRSFGERLPLPVEIVPLGWRQTVEEISAIGVEPTLRLTADHRPYVTDGHHYIVDCDWSGSSLDPHKLAGTLKGIIGVVEQGLFLDMVTDVMVVDAVGDVTITSRQTGGRE